jgi:hypothetical protein
VGIIRAMTSDESAPDASVVPRSPTGVFLCGEPCGLNNLCRMGVLAARMEEDNSVSFDIERPTEYRETPAIDHVYLLSEVPAAIQHVSDGRAKGKVVITL